MDAVSALAVSTPSTKSHPKSPGSSVMSGSPQLPVEPPRRLSSLAFSRVASPLPWSHGPLVPDTAGIARSTTPQVTTPVRTCSNMGRKRAMPSSLAPFPAVSNQSVGVDRRFETANASLQFDVAFAASPAGSIGSRLPALAIASGDRLNGPASPTQGTGGNKGYDWRYSSIPQLFSKKELDVREPFPERSPTLPSAPRRRTDQGKVFTAEPVSSGFSTPAARVLYDFDMEDDVDLPALPESSPILSRQQSPSGARGYLFSSSDGSPLPRPPVVTDLEEPLTELAVQHSQKPPGTAGEESPIVAHLRRQYGQSVAEGATPTDSPDQAIFLSTPAKAAANSAKIKRGLLKDAFRSSKNKENLEPRGFCADPLMHVAAGFPVRSDGSAFPCPDPAVHERGTSTPTMLPDRPSVPTISTPDIFGRHPHVDTTRANLQPPAPFCHRVDAKGSPLPMLKNKMPPPLPGAHDAEPGPYLSSLPPAVNRLAVPPSRPPHGSQCPSLDNEHFQPGWYNCPIAPQPPAKSSATTYKFSTAAARIIGSSPAPDLRIRDSYRTDTLTPLARPASRFRKNGIGATASRGVGRYYANAVYGGRRLPTAIPTLTSRPPSRGVPTGPPPFASSPPRLVVSNIPKRRRTRRDHHSRRPDFDIYDDNDRRSVPDTVAESVEPMEVDDSIRAAVRMSIGNSAALVTTPSDKQTEMEAEIVKRLSPNVTPYRKGQARRVKRRASYWDQDLPEVRMSSAGASADADGRRTEKVLGAASGHGRRVEGVMSSPPRGLREYHFPDEGSESRRISLDVDGDLSESDVGGLGGDENDDFEAGEAERQGKNGDGNTMMV